MTKASTARSAPQGPPKKGEAWERREDESAKAYEAFVAYRGMGAAKRSTREVARRVGKSRTQIGKWSKRWRWVERTRAYDMRIAKAQAEDEVTGAVRMNRRHIAESQKMQEVVLRFLKDFDPSEMRAADVATWLKVSTEIERKCMGLDQGPAVAVGVQVNLNQVQEEGVVVDGVQVNRRQLLICARLFPRALSMLTQRQRDELRRYEAGLPREDVGN